MTEYDRHEADRLLTRLLDLPAEERLAALDAACPDEALRSAVLRLLRLAKAPSCPVDPGSDWTDGLWRGFIAEAAKRESPIEEGTLLGPYRILEEIARGGMAVVYRAERVDGELERQVAVKILKLGLDTEEVVRRFEQERQILADLDHPHIARIYDAGRTDDGRPYFVMELVEGLPIDRYCDERRLTLEERLEQFRAVTGAVEYAHQNLVVHRDLKPSNILVTGGRSSRDDAGHVVKLLDFGIARILDAEAGGGRTAPPTRALLRLMTPEYASPEQVRGERVTTASDVYQLGVLLYELLTGHRPYDLSRRGPGELEQAICEQMPTRPSSAVAREDHLTTPSGASGTTTDTVSHARRASPARLRRRLRGDLDNIVLKALRKEPERRYSSADRLAQDIERHLAGQPVAARPDTWVYRSRKFLTRHALGAVATVVLLLAAAGLVVFHTSRIQGEWDRAEAERDRAQAEATKAQEVSALLASLFRSADPRETQGVDLTARELVDRGVERVERELAGQPEIQANMLRVLGRTYVELGLYELAENLLVRALELHRLQLGEGHADVAETLAELGRLSNLQGEHEAAREQLEEARHILESTLGDDAPQLVGVLAALGHVYRNLQKKPQGKATLERALRIQGSVGDEDSTQNAEILNSLATLLMEMGAIEQAEAHFERALAIREHKLGGDHPAVAMTLMNLAISRKLQGKLDGLEDMFRRNLAIQQKVYGPEHVRVGVALHNLGNLLSELRKYEEAIEVLQRALEVQTVALGPNHPRVANPLSGLGEAYFSAGDSRRARDLYQRSVEVREAALGTRQFDLVLFHSLVRLGQIEAALGDGGIAAQHRNRALEVWRRAPEIVDPQGASALLDLGRWLTVEERCADAVPMLQQAARIESARQAPRGEQLAEMEHLLKRCPAGTPSETASQAAAAVG